MIWLHISFFSYWNAMVVGKCRFPRENFSTKYCCWTCKYVFSPSSSYKAPSSFINSSPSCTENTWAKIRMMGKDFHCLSEIISNDKLIYWKQSNQHIKYQPFINTFYVSPKVWLFWKFHQTSITSSSSILQISIHNLVVKNNTGWLGTISSFYWNKIAIVIIQSR